MWSYTGAQAEIDTGLIHFRYFYGDNVTLGVVSGQAYFSVSIF